MSEGASCITNGPRWLSVSHPNRAVEEVLCGFALYERVGDTNDFLHQGVADQNGAFAWLSGFPAAEVKKLIVWKEPGGSP